MKDIFLLAGFQRSGSTFLSHLLNSHPEILMNNPVTPEPKFFSKSTIKPSDLGNYLDLYFKGANQNLILGDKSVSYIEKEIALKQFKHLYPKGKLILILRNPVDRAISNFNYSVKNGLEKRTIENVFIEKKKPLKISAEVSVSPFDYLKRGKYIDYIRIAQKHFRTEEILYFSLEDLVRNINLVKTVEPFFKISSHDFGRFNVDKKINGSPEKNISNDVKYELNEYYKHDLEELRDITNLDLTNWETLNDD